MCGRDEFMADERLREQLIRDAQDVVVVQRRVLKHLVEATEAYTDIYRGIVGTENRALNSAVLSAKGVLA